VVAALPDGSVCLHFGDGDKCTWPAADVASAVFVKKPLHEMRGRQELVEPSVAEPSTSGEASAAVTNTAAGSSTTEHSSSSFASSHRHVLAAGEFYGRRAEHPKWYRGSVAEEEGSGAASLAAASSNEEVPQGRLTEFFRRAARQLPSASASTSSSSSSSSLLHYGGGTLGLRLSADADPCFLGDYSQAAAEASSSSSSMNTDRAPNVHPNAAQTLQNMSAASSTSGAPRFDPLDVALEVLAATEAARKAARLGSSGHCKQGLWLAAHAPKKKWAKWGASGAGVGGAASGESNDSTNSGIGSTAEEGANATEFEKEDSALAFEAEAAALASLGAFWRAVASRSTHLMEALWTGRRDAPSPLLPHSPSLSSSHRLQGLNKGGSGGEIVGQGGWATIDCAGPAKPVCVQPGQRVLRGLPSIEAFWRQTWAAEAAAWAAARGHRGEGGSSSSGAMDNLVRWNVFHSEMFVQDQDCFGAPSVDPSVLLHRHLLV